LNEKEKAIAIIEKIIQYDENYLAAYYQLGQLYEQTKQTAKAQNAYTKGIGVARQQKNTKTLGELNTALSLIED
jgi:tetratricopeptide (TPR) repeat protein